MPHVSAAYTPAEIDACYPVMAQLRPHIARGDFFERVRQQMSQGYRLAMLVDDDEVAAVAGYRLVLNLAWGRFMYVDDLVTDDVRRSQGLGQTLFRWLVEEARRNGCGQLHLDSGVQRTAAHAFYLREGMRQSSFHFVMDLPTDVPPAMR